jgi:hypothetical protein
MNGVAIEQMADASVNRKGVAPIETALATKFVRTGDALMAAAAIVNATVGEDAAMDVASQNVLRTENVGVEKNASEAVASETNRTRMPTKFAYRHCCLITLTAIKTTEAAFTWVKLPK